MDFRKGDRVEVVDGGVDNPGTAGKRGVVFYDAEHAGGRFAVKGIDGRLVELVKGYRTYAAWQLRRI